MKIIKENLKVKYKKGLRIETDNKVINVEKTNFQYRVTGFDKSTLDMFYSPWYQSLKGVANYLLKNFEIELEYDR